MRLSDLLKLDEINIIKDAEFSHFDFIGSTSPCTLSYVEEKKFLRKAISNANVSCIITKPSLASIASKEFEGILTSDNPSIVFYRVHNKMREVTDIVPPLKPTIVAKTAKISPKAYLSPIGVIIEDNVIIEPNVTILSNVHISEGTLIRSNTAIGVDGLEARRTSNFVVSVNHYGGVKIGKNVDIGANSTIVKGLFSQNITEIGDDSKLDTVYVSHNVKIGKRTLIAALAFIGGSTIIEDDVWIGPSAVISNLIRIGKSSSVTIGSVVTSNVESNTRVSGHWAIEHRRFLKYMWKLRRK